MFTNNEILFQCTKRCKKAWFIWKIVFVFYLFCYTFLFAWFYITSKVKNGRKKLSIRQNHIVAPNDQGILRWTSRTQRIMLNVFSDCVGNTLSRNDSCFIINSSLLLVNTASVEIITNVSEVAKNFF